VAAAGIPEAYLTAFVNLVVEAGVGPGDRVLIHAGASGVGLAAVQLARLLGAEVAATTRSPEKQEALATAGATLGIAGPRDFAAEIESRWGPDAVDVVLDPVGAATLPGDVRVLAPGGRIVVIATMGGARSEIDLSLLMRKRLRLVGSTLRSRSRSEKAALVAAFRERVFSGFEAGRLRVVVDSVYSPERAALGLARMRANANTGKLLIAWDGP
jgi:NADPH:quinone reductase-like Zn-dependent oxidoreductase